MTRRGFVVGTLVAMLAVLGPFRAQALETVETGLIRSANSG
jgi:hypothetical protein